MKKDLSKLAVVGLMAGFCFSACTREAKQSQVRERTQMQDCDSGGKNCPSTNNSDQGTSSCGGKSSSCGANDDSSCNSSGCDCECRDTSVKQQAKRETASKKMNNL